MILLDARAVVEGGHRVAYCRGGGGAVLCKLASFFNIWLGNHFRNVHRSNQYGNIRNLREKNCPPPLPKSVDGLLRVAERHEEEDVVRRGHGGVPPAM